MMARMPGSPEFGIASLASVRLSHRCITVENGLTLHRYWTNARAACPKKASCTTGKERRVTRWEHEDVLWRFRSWPKI